MPTIECDECGHDQYYYCTHEPKGTDIKGLELARKKIMDLQDELLKHYKKERELSDIDVIRYDAMCEILKQVIQ